MVNHANPRIANSPAENEENEAMARAIHAQERRAKKEVARREVRRLTALTKRFPEWFDLECQLRVALAKLADVAR